jgi:GDP-L-fucose synthase
MPDGTPRKLLDISKISALGWQPTIPLADGIQSVYESYVVKAKLPNNNS